jgi:hypothetical protein
MADKKRVYNKNSGRDYTYDKAYQKQPEQAKAQAARKRARRKLEKEGVVKPFDGLDVDHKNGNPNANKRSNLHAIPKSKNRAKK